MQVAWVKRAVADGPEQFLDLIKPDQMCMIASLAGRQNLLVSFTYVGCTQALSHMQAVPSIH